MRNAIVIGAGPAGSLAALLLARGGGSVALVEQHRFPRDKVCGECLSALGLEVLDRHQLLEPLRSLGAVALRRALLHSGGGESARLELSRPMLGLSRKVLDAFLLEQARACGVTVLQPARCEAVASARAGATVRVRDLQNNQISEHAARFAILADGKAALPGGAPPPTGDFGIKCHWTEVDGPTDAIELFGCTGCYGGLAPIEGGRWNAAFAVPAARLKRHRGDLEALFAELLQENPILRGRMRRARRVSSWLAAPLPRFAVVKHWPRGVIPIGNAAAAIEPIGGEGMGLALRSAELAAEAISDPGGAMDPCALTKRFSRLWRAPRLLCRAGALLAGSRSLAPAAFEYLAMHPSIGGQVVRAIGK